MRTDNFNVSKIKMNIFFTIFAQLCSLLFSVIMSLIVPKLLGIREYSYWQLFIFYASYVGFAHLGITDGMYLKAGGKKIDKIDKNQLTSLFWHMIFSQFVFSIFLFAFTMNIQLNHDRKFVLYMTAIYMICANITWFLEFVFQATDNIKSYSHLTIASKMYFIIFLFVDIFIRNGSFKYFVSLFVLSQLIAAIYGMYRLRTVLFSFSKRMMFSIKNTFLIAKAGIKLTISNTISTLILGIGQFFIDSRWGIDTFGMFSFSFSLTTFILQFISQVSIVFFPALRKVNHNNRTQFFKIFHHYLNLLLPLVLVGYVPLKLIMNFWLPEYSLSFYWLAFLLPICIFDGKMNILFSVFFKVEREESILLKYNIIPLIFSALVLYISVFILHTKILVPIAITASIFLRSFLSELKLCHEFDDEKSIKKSLYELVYVIIYYLLIVTGNYLLIFIGTVISYFVFCFDRELVNGMLTMLFKKVGK